MDVIIKHKNKLAVLLIVITVTRLSLKFFIEGLRMSDLLDALIPFGGALLLLFLKAKKNTSS